MKSIIDDPETTVLTTPMSKVEFDYLKAYQLQVTLGRPLTDEECRQFEVLEPAKNVP